MLFTFKSNEKIEDIVQRARDQGMSEENIDLLIEVRLLQLEEHIKGQQYGN